MKQTVPNSDPGNSPMVWVLTKCDTRIILYFYISFGIFFFFFYITALVMVVNYNMSNQGSNATLWRTNPLSGKLLEWEREWLMKESAVGHILWSSFHFDLDLLWHIRLTFPLHWASGCSLEVLPSRSFLFPSPLFLNFLLLSFNLAHTQTSCIYIVMSSLTLPVCLCHTQVEPGVQGLSRERLSAENTQLQQDKRTPPIPSPHPLAHTFGLTPSSVMQDPRIQSLR